MILPSTEHALLQNHPSLFRATLPGSGTPLPPCIVVDQVFRWVPLTVPIIVTSECLANRGRSTRTMLFGRARRRRTVSVNNSLSAAVQSKEQERVLEPRLKVHTCAPLLSSAMLREDHECICLTKPRRTEDTRPLARTPRMTCRRRSMTDSGREKKPSRLPKLAGETRDGRAAERNPKRNIMTARRMASRYKLKIRRLLPPRPQSARSSVSRLSDGRERSRRGRLRLRTIREKQREASVPRLRSASNCSIREVTWCVA